MVGWGGVGCVGVGADRERSVRREVDTVQRQSKRQSQRLALTEMNTRDRYAYIDKRGTIKQQRQHRRGKNTRKTYIASEQSGTRTTDKRRKDETRKKNTQHTRGVYSTTTHLVGYTT